MMKTKQMFNVIPQIKHVENVAGTGLRGYVVTTYQTLVDAFGKPTCEFDSHDKINVEWKLTIDDVLVTIYDWKEPELIKTEYQWHVGGYDFKDPRNGLNFNHVGLVQKCIDIAELVKEAGIA